MIRKRLFAGLLLIAIIVAAYGQTTMNQRDAAGRKQGYWEAVDSKGALVYTAYFKDDKPVGEMKRYHPTGGVRVITYHDRESTKTRARFFWQNGELAARGNYIDNQRDSVWLYYSFNAKSVSRRVEYDAGKQNGKEQSFYPDGSLAEEIIWENGLKNGHWKQYFNSGQLKSITTYVNNKLEGSFTAFEPDGKTSIEGVYRNNVSDGDWKRYDEKGDLVITIKYDKGVITNYEELETTQHILFENMMEQLGKIPEPTEEELLRGGNWW